MEGVAGLGRPADGSFQGAGANPLPSDYLPMENAPLRREEKGGEVPPASPPAFLGQKGR